MQSLRKQCQPHCDDMQSYVWALRYVCLHTWESVNWETNESFDLYRNVQTRKKQGSAQAISRRLLHCRIRTRVNMISRVGRWHDTQHITIPNTKRTRGDSSRGTRRMLIMSQSQNNQNNFQILKHQKNFCIEILLFPNKVKKKLEDWGQTFVSEMKKQRRTVSETGAVCATSGTHNRTDSVIWECTLKVLRLFELSFKQEYTSLRVSCCYVLNLQLNLLS